MASSSDIDTPATSWPQTATDNHPYNYSIASSASSSSSSVFSIEAPSSSSSQRSATPSSTRSLLNVTWGSDNENESSYPHNRRFSQESIQDSSVQSTSLKSSPVRDVRSETKPSCAVVALESRQHPRRTQRSFETNTKSGGSGAFHARTPPALVRQCERKGNFVDSLVGKLIYSILMQWLTTSV